MLKNLDWEDLWYFLLYAACVSFIALFIVYCTADKKTIRYSFGGKGDEFKIVREIEWYEDDVIRLDRSVSYWDAIHMVDSLNATLKNK